MTISNLPLRIPVHFQPIKPTSDLQIIIEWIICTKHPILTSNPQHIHQRSQTLHARRRDIKVTLLIIHHGQLRRLESHAGNASSANQRDASTNGKHKQQSLVTMAQNDFWRWMAIEQPGYHQPQHVRRHLGRDPPSPPSHAEPARESKLAYTRCWPGGGGMRGYKHGSTSSAASARSSR